MIGIIEERIVESILQIKHKHSLIIQKFTQMTESRLHKSFEKNFITILLQKNKKVIEF